MKLVPINPDPPVTRMCIPSWRITERWGACKEHRFSDRMRSYSL